MIRLATKSRNHETNRRFRVFVFSWLLIVIAALSAATLSVAPSDLTGRWIWRVPNGDGTFRETVFVLNADGPGLAGSVITPTSEQPLVDDSAADRIPRHAGFARRASNHDRAAGPPRAGGDGGPRARQRRRLSRAH